MAKKQIPMALTRDNGRVTMVTVAPRCRYLRPEQFEIPFGTPEDEIERFVENKYGAGRKFETHSYARLKRVSSSTLTPISLPRSTNTDDYFPGVL